MTLGSNLTANLSATLGPSPGGTTTNTLAWVVFSLFIFLAVVVGVIISLVVAYLKKKNQKSVPSELVILRLTCLLLVHLSMNRQLCKNSKYRTESKSLGELPTFDNLYPTSCVSIGTQFRVDSVHKHINERCFFCCLSLAN